MASFIESSISLLTLLLKTWQSYWEIPFQKLKIIIQNMHKESRKSEILTSVQSKYYANRQIFVVDYRDCEAQTNKTCMLRNSLVVFCYSFEIKGLNQSFSRKYTGIDRQHTSNAKLFCKKMSPSLCRFSELMCVCVVRKHKAGLWRTWCPTYTYCACLCKGFKSLSSHQSHNTSLCSQNTHSHSSTPILTHNTHASICAPTVPTPHNKSLAPFPKHTH